VRMIKVNLMYRTGHRVAVSVDMAGLA